MKLSDVLRKERVRNRLTVEQAAEQLGVSVGVYGELEQGASPIEAWGPKLAQIAIKLSVPTSRLISETGRAAQANERNGQCGELIKRRREKCELSREELARRLEWIPEELASVEDGSSPLEEYAPLLLRFAEMIHQPIFNLFYPCGLPFSELRDYR